jgi:uncharacterized protein (TIGR03083 family)
MARSGNESAREGGGHVDRPVSVDSDEQVTQDRDARMVATATLFRPLGRELVTMLGSLDHEMWSCRTSAAEWTVRDVVAHLLDVDLRRLSSTRDGYLPPPRSAITGNEDLVTYLNELNREWVDAARRLSPRVLVELLEWSTAEVAAVMEAADPSASATFPVGWAGQDTSPMWLDIGREYTERWHHQDQVRDACDIPPLRAPEWLRPVIAISLHALPYAYRGVAASPGTRVALHVTGEAGGDWWLHRSATEWTLHAGRARSATCRISAQDLALARLLLHRLTPHEGTTVFDVEGDAELAEPLRNARAVMV